MACGLCGNKNKGTASSFSHTAPDGTKTKNLSEAQARALQIRNGGTFRRE